MFDFDYDEDGNFYIHDFSMVIDNGRDIDMQQICDCANHIDEFVTMDWCERNCPKHHRCCNISLANDILKAYEEGVNVLISD